MMQSLSFTDKQIALLLNALQFAMVAVKRHPQAEDETERHKELLLGMACVGSASDETMCETHTMLHDAAQNMRDAELYEIDPNAMTVNPVSEREPETSGYEPGTGPFNAMPRNGGFAGLTPSEIERRKNWRKN